MDYSSKNQKRKSNNGSQDNSKETKLDSTGKLKLI